MTRKFLSQRKFKWAAAAVFLVTSTLLLTPRAAWSQANSATLYGNVTDPSGGVIPGATVTLTKQDTQAATSKTTNSTGDFTFTFVPIGIYTLRIEAKGFTTYVATGITLTAGQQVRQTYSLHLGEATQTVTVTGSVPLINTVSAQQLHAFQQTEIRQLPLLNRNISNLLSVGAGVNQYTGSQGGVQMNGVGIQGTRYTVDGTNSSGNL